MIFELSSEQQALRDEAHGIATDRLMPIATRIDESATISSDVLRDVEAVVSRAGSDPIALVAVVEELASASAAAALAAALPVSPGDNATLSGLRGFAVPAAGDARSLPRARLVMAAVALGLARAAISQALNDLRESAQRSQDQDKPHWAVADAATELAAARVLTLQAAQVSADDAEGQPAMAKLAATRAAQQAVDVAVRVVGANALAPGSLLERLARDVRATSVVLGTEEELRAAVADAVLPR
jgi:alkylation response protein AidB-like acyl-CoA dehydrogenase